MLGRSLRSFGSFLPKPIVLAAYRRTPIGSFRGQLAEFSAVQLGALAIKESLQASGLKAEDIAEVIVGNVVQAGTKQSPARQAALGAGLLQKTVCTTVHKACASGMKAIAFAAQGLALRPDEIVIAGGFESLSRVPYLLLNYRSGHQMLDTKIYDAMFYDGLNCPHGKGPMGALAEKTNEKYGITREEQDDFAISSYKRSAEAWARGFYKGEIFTVLLDGGKKGKMEEDQEYKNVKFDKIPKLKPTFVEKGSITAANSSKINDGAAMVVVMTEEMARAKGVQPLGRIVSFADAATDPVHFEVAPSMAIEKALKYANLTKDQIDLYEINEAFSSAAVVNRKLLSIPQEKLNVNGGAVSLGHPVGASGARITGTLLRALQERKQRYGAAAICNGGGGATAIIVEAL